MAQYKVEELRSMVQEWITAQQWYYEVERMERDARIYHSREAYASESAWFIALKTACKMLGVDMKTAIAVEKSIRRNTQYKRRWESEPHFSWWNWDHTGTEDSYRKAVAADTTSHYFNY